jgi:aminomethyltransferase
MEEMKETCLHDRHVKLGALMSPFGGFDMPIQYEGIVEEHNAVRKAVGVFDVSHMGEVLVSGPESEKFVNYIFTNDLTGAENGKIFYGMMLHPTGGVVDDLLVYKRNDTEFFLVINAANIDKDVAWIQENAAKFDVKVDHLSDSYGELAIQGPEAEKTLKDVLGIDAGELGFYTFKDITIDGEPAIVSRTGYTGEDGFEVYASPEKTQMLWDKLMAAGVAPCGLGCRDTLRFEAGLPLYGDELTDEITPIEGGLGMFVKLEKPDFIGREVVAEQKANGVTRKVIGLEVNGQAIPRHGYDVLNENDEVIGAITTGYHSITLDKNLAMALIDAKYAKLGTPIKVKVRRKVFPAVVVKKRFYTPNYKK